jgi:RNA recognition motif-containing protein
MPTQHEPTTKLFIANISYTVSEEELFQKIAEFGEVKSLHLPFNHQTGTHKGFGFVEMATAESATQVIRNLHNTTMKGRNLTVEFQKPRAEGQTNAAPSRPPDSIPQQQRQA